MGDKPINLLADVHSAHRPEAGQMEFKGIRNIAAGEGMIAVPKAVFASYYEGADGNIKKQMIGMDLRALENVAQRQRSESFETFPHNEQQFIKAYRELGAEVTRNRKMGVPHDSSPVLMSASEFREDQIAAVSPHRESFAKASTAAPARAEAAPAVATKTLLAVDPQIQADAEAAGMTAKLVLNQLKFTP